MKEQLAKILFAIARSKTCGPAVRWSFANLSSIMPVKKVYKDDQILAFWHPRPAYEKHILVVPKKSIKSFINLDSQKILLKVQRAVKKIVIKNNWEEKGYRLIVNGGAYQDIQQLHFHLVSGQKLGKSD